MGNVLYRLTQELEVGYSDRRVIVSDYLDYEEVLTDYLSTIKNQTDVVRASEYDMEPYFVIKEDHLSNPAGKWHWCNLKTDEGDIWDLRIEPIQYFEAKHFASKEIEAKYKAIYE